MNVNGITSIGVGVILQAICTHTLYDELPFLVTIIGDCILFFLRFRWGLARMNYWKFLLYTTIGASVWHSILAAMGWYLHSIVPQEQLHEKIMEYGEYIKFIILGIVVIAILFFLVKRIVKNKKKEA